MTDLPDTTTLKRLLAQATPGPWQTSGGRGPERSLYGHDVGPDGKPVALVDYPPPGRHVADDIHFRCRANARLIALAPSLAARVIEQDARIARLTEALRLHQAWSDSEDAGPDYGAQTRDTHPDGERIWRQWWDGNLDLCARAQEATRTALEDGQ